MVDNFVGGMPLIDRTRKDMITCRVVPLPLLRTMKRHSSSSSLPPNVGKIVRRVRLKVPPPKNRAAATGGYKPKSSFLSGMQWARAGIPMVLFSILSAWVVGNAYGGKLREMEVAQGKASISLRQAALEAEHDEMMERLSKIVASDFDNTKRIKRPEEILEERRLERQRRNAWHRRFYRWITQQDGRKKD